MDCECVDDRASNKPSRSLKLYNHGPFALMTDQFQPREGLSMGLLCENTTTNFAKIRLELY